MIPFNYHHLYYFYVIAEAGSVTAAAKTLRLSQSSLSMQLAQFEVFLERKLFLREGRRLYLTEDGSAVLSYAKAIFDLGQELTDALGDRPRTGRLRIQIGVSGLVPKSFVDTLLQFLLAQEEKPLLNVAEKTMEEMMKDLSVHKLDMILSDLPCRAQSDEGIENHRIAHIPVSICAGPALAKKICRIPADLEKAPMIIPTSQSQVYHALQEYFLSRNVKPNIIAEIQDLELVRRLVLAGKGIAPINQWTILKGPAKEKLKILGKPDQLGIFDSVYLIKKARKNKHPLVRRILERFHAPSLNFKRN